MLILISILLPHWIENVVLVPTLFWIHPISFESLAPYDEGLPFVAI